MAVDYRIQVADPAGAYQLGQMRFHDLQAAREQASQAPLRKRMQELGVQRQEQAVKAQEIDFQNENVRRYMTDAYRISQIEDPNLRVQEATRLAESYLQTPDPTDDEAAGNILSSIENGTFDQLLGATVEAAQASGIVKPPRQASQASVPDSIEEAQFAYPDDPVKQREYVARRARGSAQTAEERAAIAKAETMARGEAELEISERAAKTPGTPEYQRVLEAETKRAEESRRAAEAAAKELERSKAGKVKEANARRYSTIVSEHIDDAIKTVVENPFWTTGFVGGQVLSGLGGTEASNLKATLDTIEAGVAFDRLQAMRDASPTGGALGQVSEMELTLLKAALGSVRQSQSADQLERRLLRMKEVYNDIVHGQAGAPDQSAPTEFGSVEEAEAANLPPGTEIIIGGRRAIVE